MKNRLNKRWWTATTNIRIHVHAHSTSHRLKQNTQSQQINIMRFCSVHRTWECVCVHSSVSDCFLPANTNFHINIGQYRRFLTQVHIYIRADESCNIWWRHGHANMCIWNHWKNAEMRSSLFSACLCTTSLRARLRWFDKWQLSIQLIRTITIWKLKTGKRKRNNIFYGIKQSI